MDVDPHRYPPSAPEAIWAIPAAVLASLEKGRRDLDQDKDEFQAAYLYESQPRDLTEIFPG